MKKLCLLLFFLPAALYAGQQHDYIDKFATDFQGKLVSYSQEGDLEKFLASGYAVTDEFVLAFFSREIKESDPFLAFADLKEGKISNRQIHLELEAEYHRVRIGISFVSGEGEETVEETLNIFAYPVAGHGTSTYYIYYDLYKRIDRGSIEPRRGPDYRGFGTFRFVQFNQAKLRYTIVARFEESNVYRYNGPFVFTSPDGQVVSVEQFGGDLYGLSFASRRDGSIAFATGGGILPDASGIIPGRGANHWTDYRINWILTRGNRLYATEIVWDFNAEIEDEHRNPVKKKPQIIKLNRQ
jgi:hypothetical protein